jgi:hypothetical protein
MLTFFSVGPIGDVSALHGEGDSDAAHQFEEILGRTAPDVVHLDGVSPAQPTEPLPNRQTTRLLSFA